MSSHEPRLLESGDLVVCPELGEMRSAAGECTRLGPVNMKVLALLMDRAGEVVSRAEIFESVWRNQVVGDDVLTRAISDVRAEIKRLSKVEGLIETLPKRGYRWTADVRRTSAVPGSTAPLASSLVMEPSDRDGGNSRDGADSRDGAEGIGRSRLLAWAFRGAVYAVLLVVIATVGVWLMGQLARPQAPIVAVLPIIAEPAQHELAARIEQHLSDYLIRLDRVDLLARSAVESRPTNPFPYFYYEFGASWLIEAELRRMSPTVLTIDLVDARTGIVLLQSSAAVDEKGPTAFDIEGHLRPLAAFFESQAGR